MILRALIVIALALAVAALGFGTLPGHDVLVASRECPMQLLPVHGHVDRCDPGWHPSGETMPAGDTLLDAVAFAVVMLPAIFVWRRLRAWWRALVWSGAVWLLMLVVDAPLDFDLRLDPGDRWPVAVVAVLMHAVFALVMAGVPVAAIATLISMRRSRAASV